MARVSQDYYEKKRSEIMEAAYRVCIRKPITSVAMKDIIEEAGYSHGAIYKYYKDLDEVICDLMIRVNRQYSFDEDLKEIIGRYGSAGWQNAIREICALLAEHMVRMGTDLVRMSLYCAVFTVSEPERTRQILEKAGEESISPLLDSVSTLKKYLEALIKECRLHPVRSADEIIRFIVTYYSGVEESYVLSEAGNDPGESVDSVPGQLFSVLADALIPMLTGIGNDKKQKGEKK
jgi:AcrR family transcriptional regulator